MKTSIVLLSGLVVLGVLAPRGQAAPAKPPKEMASLSFMVGKWNGHGWIEFHPGKRDRFKSEESVRSKLGGHVLVIDGIHRDSAGKVVHNAFGVLSYDARKRSHRFRSYLASGRSGDYDASYRKGVLTWTMKTPRFTMRYAIRLNKRGQWSEIGEISYDGKKWRKFFKMTLDKVN
jgi:hypothetical protein